MGTAQLNQMLNSPHLLPCFNPELVHKKGWDLSYILSQHILSSSGVFSNARHIYIYIYTFVISFKFLLSCGIVISSWFCLMEWGLTFLKET